MDVFSEEIPVTYSKSKLDRGGEVVPQATFLRFPDPENTSNKKKSQFDKYGHTSYQTYEDYLTTLDYFANAMVKGGILEYDFADAAEVPELFANFEECFYSTALDSWYSTMDLFDDNPTSYGHFQELVTEFSKGLLPDDCYDIQVRYIENTRKPKSLDVMSFSRRRQRLNHLLRFLPRDEMEEDQEFWHSGSIESTRFKRTFIVCMPKHWQTQFRLNNHTRDESLEEMVNYFKLIENLEHHSIDRSGNRGGRRNTPPRGRSRSNNFSSTNNSGRNNIRRGGETNTNNPTNNRRGGDNQSQGFNKPVATSPCPIHGPSHTWSNCRQNPESGNYNPAKARPAGNPNQGGFKPPNNNRNPSSGRQQAYHHEDASDEEQEDVPNSSSHHENENPDENDENHNINDYPSSDEYQEEEDAFMNQLMALNEPSYVRQDDW